MGIPLGGANPRKMRSTKQAGDRLEPLGMTWGKDKKEIRVHRLKIRPRFHKGGLFTIQCAAGNNDAMRGRNLFKELGGFGFFCNPHIELEVARHADGLRW